MTTPKKERDMPQQTPPVKPRTSSYRNRSLAGLLAAGCCLLLAACGQLRQRRRHGRSVNGRPPLDRARSGLGGPGNAGRVHEERGHHAFSSLSGRRAIGHSWSRCSRRRRSTQTTGRRETPALFQAAMKKCGGSFGRPGSPPSGSGNGTPPSGSGGPGGTQSAATPAPFKASGG